MSDTVSDRADRNRPTSDVVGADVQIVVTINPGDEYATRVLLDVEDLDRAMHHRSNGRSWTQALVAVAVER